MNKILYLDNAATTPVDGNVAKKIQKIMINCYGNASSIHQIGRNAEKAMEDARQKIAKFINAEPDEIIFTSGGTESNNLAIRGLALANVNKKHIITSVIEHPAVLETCKSLEKQGYKVDYVKVNENGIVDLKEIESKITNDTLLVSVMHVNNEIGTIQPVEEIGKICKSKGVLFFSDAVQSFGKLKVDVKKMNIDLLSVSGHKINAPKGIGLLYIKKGISIKPILTGGGQERNIRSGTENIAGIVGIASAIELKRKEKEVLNSRNKLIKEILKLPGSRINGTYEKDKRIYNNVNVSFYGIEGESLALMLDNYGICVSTGSACSSHKLEESHVLKAIGVDVLYIHGSLRLTLDTLKPLSEKDIKFIVSKIKESVDKLRKLSPFKLGEEKIK
jgi:cysteine desulfurase